MNKDKMQLWQATLNLLILRALKLGPIHDYGVSAWSISGRKQPLQGVSNWHWQRLSSAINLVLGNGTHLETT
jgi:hypothetical protein